MQPRVGAAATAADRAGPLSAQPLPVARPATHHARDVPEIGGRAANERLGWRLDIDFKPTEHTRGVQLTPPGSPTSIQFGEGTMTMREPMQGLLLIVDDIEAARDELIGRGVKVSEIWHDVPGQGRLAGVDPERRSYLSRAAFADPDGNTWQLQEITERLPGRV